MTYTPPNVGDVVQLRSGGPRMTVRSVEADGTRVRTCWMDDQNQLQENAFPSVMLRRLQELPPPVSILPAKKE